MRKYIFTIVFMLLGLTTSFAQKTSKKFGLLDKWSVGFETGIQNQSS
ncbi:hypothetical protein [Prevotella pallens]|nr:hypothetical protein [Prevotella pallens]